MIKTLKEENTIIGEPKENQWGELETPCITTYVSYSTDSGYCIYAYKITKVEHKEGYTTITQDLFNCGRISKPLNIVGRISKTKNEQAIQEYDKIKEELIEKVKLKFLHETL